MRRTLLLLAILFTGTIMWTPALSADGCYICGSGSTDACRDYCRYSGSDTFDNRKKCEKAGCKVSGTASCPTAVNYKVCNALQERSISEMLLAHFQVRVQ
ncbi:hypothetical protein Lepil_3803 [Leptonema illini DSM 21528]|uniref:Lipoprotein n=2 Tax=Leptonema illini TaxID=183 RepID=H2CAS8_9LEPT|nr:hypothetical protein Lepil_3803 [Leptonema illini DSM 21528]